MQDSNRFSLLAIGYVFEGIHFPGEEDLIATQYYLKDQSGFDDNHCNVLQIPADRDFIVW